MELFFLHNAGLIPSGQFQFVQRIAPGNPAADGKSCHNDEKDNDYRLSFSGPCRIQGNLRLFPAFPGGHPAKEQATCYNQERYQAQSGQFGCIKMSHHKSHGFLPAGHNDRNHIFRREHVIVDKEIYQVGNSRHAEEYDRQHDNTCHHRARPAVLFSCHR